MKQSELLRKQADIIDLAEKHGIDDYRKLVKIKFGGACYQVADKELYSDQQYQFALGVVEGKPVFEGDDLYTKTGLHIVASKSKEKNAIDGSIGGIYYISELSWNPPKTKTVMVELLVDDAEAATKWIDSVKGAMTNIGIACREALESIKQS